MKLYQVFAPGGLVYVLQARSITHAMNFVRHWPNVAVHSLRTYSDWDVRVSS